VKKYLSDPPVNMKPAGIFKEGENGIFDVQSVGESVPGPETNERRVTITCDEEGCKEQLFSVGHQDSASILSDLSLLGWSEADDKNYCPKHSGGHIAAVEPLNKVSNSPLDLDAELGKAERAAGFGDFPAHEPDFSHPPDSPVAHPLPMHPLFDTISGGWFVVFVLLILIIAGLVIYADTLRREIDRYEFSLTLVNASSFEHNASIQRLDCAGHDLQRCSGVIINEGESRPVRYNCDSTHCAFECGGGK